MIDIKDIQGSIIYSTDINKGAKRKLSLMKEDYVVLPFSLDEPLSFGLGSYAEIDGVRFEVTDLQKPTLNATTGAYDYELRLDAYYWKWKNKVFKFTPEVGGQEASWSLTASLDVHLGILLRNLKALGYTYGGVEFEFSIDATVENKAMSLVYENMNMIDALSAMAESWECEWWVTDNIINFGRCEYGTAVDFEIGKNVAEMSRSESQSSYATRLYVFGSTKNIPSSYRPVDESVVVNGVVQRRLMLPEGTPYIDAYENMSEEEAVEEVVILEDIYPKTDGNISTVSTYEDTVENEDGTTTTETFYRFTDSGFTFSEDYVLEGEELKVSFTSGTLNGMEFGVVFNPKGAAEKNEDGTWNSEAQLYEIVANEDYGRKLPDATLYPKAGDTYVLSGWDSTKIADLGLVSKAEQELLTEGLKISEKRKIDPNTYNCKMFSDYMYGLDEDGNQDNSFSKHFELGDKVNLINPAYFDNGRQSRIIGYEYNLDYTFDNPVYTVGETASYSRIGELENKVDALTLAGQTYIGGSGSGVYVIGTNDLTKATNRNVYSALRSDANYLNKTKDDRSKGKISSDKAIEVGNFVTGASGAIIQVDASTGQTIAELDKLYVRMKAYFETLEIINVNSVGGKQILSPAGSVKCIGVEETDDAYRCYFLGEQDGEVIENRFEEGDQAYSQMFNAKEGVSNKVSNKYYWRLVTGVSSDVVDYNNQKCHYIDLSKTDCDTDSDIPETGDVINHRGSRYESDRMNFIEFSSVGTNAPYITLFQGVNSYSLENKEYVAFGYDQSTAKAYMNVYGDMYVGDRDGTSFLKYTQEGGLELKGKLSVGTTLKKEDGSEGTLEELISASSPEGYEEFVKQVTETLDGLQNQIDGAIETWFYEGVPTLDNAPASDWDTDELKNMHLGDLYYDQATGKAYRFQMSGDEYVWQVITDTDIQAALEAANKAKDTADGKRRVFVGTDTPSVPYDEGDLWSRGSEYPLLVCVTPKTEDESYEESDWEYADDSVKTKEEILKGYLYQALAQSPSTEIENGLVLSSLIQLRDADSNIMSGINGLVLADKGSKSIATWWGGDMYDLADYYTWDGTGWVAKEDVSIPGSIPNGLIRFDGTGYFAAGKFWWDKSGEIHADPTALLLSFDAETGDETLAATIINIRKDMAAFAAIWSRKTDASGNEYLYTELPVVTQQGITMYADATTLDVESIYSGLPIDKDTIYWEETTDADGNVTQVLKAKSSSSGGSADSVAWANITDKPTFATVATSGKYSDLSEKPESLKNPNALTFGSKTYDGSEAKTVLASDLGALTEHQDIYTLTFSAGSFSAGSFTANSEKKTINVPTTTTHISEGGNLYFTNARARAAITGGASSILTSNLTVSRALVSDESGKVAASDVTSTELGYLDGVTSSVQTQLDGKLSLSGGTMTGTIKSQAVYPKTTNTYALGASSYLWSNLYTKKATIDGISIYKSTTGVLYIDGDLVVSGGVTMYGTDSVDTSTIMSAIAVDGTTIMNDGTKLYLNPDIELGGGLDESALATYLASWAGSTSIKKVGTITSGTWNGTKIANDYLANSSITISGTSVSLGGSITQSALRTALGLGSNAYTSTAYLPLSGGTITGSDNSPLIINTTVGRMPYITFQDNGTTGGSVGGNSTGSMFIQAGTSDGTYSVFRVNKDGSAEISTSGTYYDVITDKNASSKTVGNATKFSGYTMRTDATFVDKSVEAYIQYKVDATALSTSYFYPIVFTSSPKDLYVRMYSTVGSASFAYNQNKLEFTMRGQGWNDTPAGLTVHNYNCYTASEMTIGCIGMGQEAGERVVWVRGGLTYFIIANQTPTLKTSDYTSGNQIYTVGTNFYGGTNTKVTVYWTPQSTSGLGAMYHRGGLVVGGAATFANTLTLNGILLKKSQDGVLYIDGDLVVKGAVTMYGDDAISASTIMDGIRVDDVTISKANGYLEVIGGVSGGGLDDVVVSGSGNAITSATLSNNVLTLTKDTTFLTQETGDVRYVTGLSTDGNYVTWTKNGTTNNLTVPFATNAGNISTKAPQLAAASESDNINVVVNAYGAITTNSPGSGAAITKAIRFRWYDDYWQIGAVRGGSVASLGWGVTKGATDLRFLVTDNGINVSGNINTNVNNSYSIGSSTYKFANVYATTFVGALSGNATTATTASKLATARTISLTGNVTGSGSFDGSANLSITTTIPTRSIVINGLNYTVHSTITTDTTGIYAPTSGGTSGHVLQANDSTSAPTWVAQSSLSVGNATTATTASKLSTVSKTAWGQTYWTSGGVPASISGDMTGVGNITPSASGTYALGSSSALWGSVYAGTYNVSSTRYGMTTYTNGLELKTYSLFKLTQNGTTRLSMNSNGYVGIGTSSPSDTLHVVGTSCFSDTLSAYEIEVTNNGGSSSGHLRFTRTSANYIVAPSGGSLCLNVSGTLSSAGSEMVVVDGNIYPGTTGVTSLGKSGNLWNGLYLYGGSTSNAFNNLGITFGADVARISANTSGGLGLYAIGTASQIALRAGCTTSAISSTGITIDVSGNLLATGGVTMYSDIRKKTKLRDVVLSLEQVAEAPLIEHYYNSDEKKTTHVGSIAQYWASLNDWFCKEDDDGFYTMEIQNAALASAISVARELSRYESETDRRIRLLEQENRELRKEIEKLKAL